MNVGCVLSVVTRSSSLAETLLIILPYRNRSAFASRNEVDILTKFRLFNKFFSLFFLLEAILEIGLSDTPWDRGSS